MPTHFSKSENPMTMSNHSRKTEQVNNNTMQQPNKPKRKSVQFGRVSYSDETNERQLSQHSDANAETPYKFMERSAMCSSVPIPPPCPPQRKASAEVVLVDGEIVLLDNSSEVDDFGSDLISMTSLLSLVTSETSEEEKEEETDDSDSSVRYTTPLMTTMHKTLSPVAPTRTRPRLGVSPSQLPPRFPTRCL